MKKTDPCFDILRNLKSFSPVSNYVFEKGVIFESSNLTSEEDDFLRSTITLLGSSVKTLPKQCYSNSQIFLLGLNSLGMLEEEDMKIEYCEGVFIDKNLPIPISHGWISLNGKVVDLTLTQKDYLNDIPLLQNKVVAQIPQNSVYLGIDIDKSFVLNRMLNEHIAWSVLDDGKNSLEYLKLIGEI